eukprot:TRINITY_DN5728_c0_g1_i1.p1 TRINITY_DN5728_c0_g1~~TRINITY_DN5728_c0_g1_i1.p1  ORF type:complete len:352 (-),score=50.40 TRINITY_DN5728_c0_g1_i1:340-1320(-)
MESRGRKEEETTNNETHAGHRKKRRKQEDTAPTEYTLQTRLHASFQDVDEVTNQNYWRLLCPDLHVNDNEFINDRLSKLELVVLSKRQTQSLRESMLTEGYFQLDNEDINWVCSLKKIESAILTLREQGWHPLWIIVYDEVWLIAYQIFELLRRLVNKNLIFNRDFFAWFIDNESSEGGWEPHRDRHSMTFTNKSEPNYATVWIAITPATPENSCIYLLPATHDPSYFKTSEEGESEGTNVSTNSIDFDSLGNLRAVPVLNLEESYLGAARRCTTVVEAINEPGGQESVSHLVRPLRNSKIHTCETAPSERRTCTNSFLPSEADCT